jgi:CheY-like chemotaxis protein
MPQVRLLSIEDDKKISHLIGRVATEMGFSVCVANEPEDIIPLYKSFRPHIVILDILMPGKDGFEVLKFLGKRKSKAHVIILSGSEYNNLAEVLRLTSAMVTSLGYNVIEAMSGEMAIGILKIHDDIDLLLTDVILSGQMNGAELADEALRMRPNLKVLFNSGYAESAIFKAGIVFSGGCKHSE